MKIFEESIGKTGFLLEYRVSRILKDHNWSVINNKYYIDDVQGTVREIDIVAYKAKFIDKYYVYTTLIISCKKSEENAWALLSKEKEKDDPNMIWYPFHIWTNDKIFDFMLLKNEWQNEYIEFCKEQKLFSELFDSSSHIFAFQEMNKSSGRVQNDKNIFESISSLMKAQGYELSMLESRKKQSCVYQFNLISLIESDLITLNFSDTEIKAEKIDEAKYVGNYILNHKEVFSKIHFVNFDAFNKILNNYDNLHIANINYFQKKFQSYFYNIFNDSKRIEIFIDELRKELIWRINSTLSTQFEDHETVKKLWLWWSKKNKILDINIDTNTAKIDYLNQDARIEEKTKELLQHYYGYSGPFRFLMDDLPF